MYKTTDLWFAAFLQKSGFEVTDIDKSTSKGAWIFNIEPIRLKELRLEFSKSEFSNIKFMIEKLKDMLY